MAGGLGREGGGGDRRLRDSLWYYSNLHIVVVNYLGM